MDPRCSQQWESSMEDVSTPLLPLRDDGRADGRSCSALSSLLANKYLAIAAGPLASALICAFVDFGHGRGAARNMLGALAWVFIWWLTDAVPLGVASMAPLFLFPAFGISSSDAVAKAYMDDVISLVLGSFILALAIEHYNIHRRLALNITSLFCGDPVRPPLLLLGICGTTMFISMWIHNTPCTVMMMPVATGILQRFPRGQAASSSADAHEVRRFSKAVVLGVMYASTIGGMSTLTGTGANIILVGMWSTYFPEQRPITFSSWMSFGFPVALVLFAALWVTLCLMYCSSNTGRALSAYLDRTHLRRELSLLGPMAFAEKMVLAIFGGLIVLWMTRSLTNDIPGWGVLFHGKVGDGTVTIMMTTLLFIIPNGKGGGEKLMDWGKCRKLQWNIILLLGAGFAIAEGFKASGLTDILSEGLGFLRGAPPLVIAPVACVFSAAITEFTSDDAATTLVLPLLAELGKTIGVHPLLLMVPGTVGAQLSYLLPTASPPNVVGFGTGYITIKDMVLTGIPIKVVGVATLAVLLPTLGSVVFGMDQKL
ncbi:hypothetical protein CFC21_046995 [Triticum aestivum]|uniref:Tonoplast dicarboxylate transporter n=2 Tax=Triticum aestivum TaxID=4565 RepID=A0A3B6GQ48_WHEAT|nr:tonoplast dicarboxylate transporter-like [Triticum aestivum]KAF7036283.1 hypothetical protein CFC21_046995 [Triticum aestivum]